MLEWMTAILGKPVKSIAELKDGVTLCELANKISVGCVKKINNSTMPFKQMENITAFLVACRGAGVKSHDLFETVDLFEGKDYGLVVQSIMSYGSIVSNKPGFTGPTLGVKVAERNEREFSEATLAKGRGAVPRTNQGKIMDHGTVTHKDINMGAKASGDSAAAGVVPKHSSGPAIDFGKDATHRDIGFGAKHAGVSTSSAVPKANQGRLDVEAPASSSRDIKFGANAGKK